MTFQTFVRWPNLATDDFKKKKNQIAQNKMIA